MFEKSLGHSSRTSIPIPTVQRVTGADPEGSIYSGGSGRPYLAEGVGEDMWPDAYGRTIPDEILSATDAESFDITRRLAREEGVLLGARRDSPWPVR